MIRIHEATCYQTQRLPDGFAVTFRPVGPAIHGNPVEIILRYQSSGPPPFAVGMTYRVGDAEFFGREPESGLSASLLQGPTMSQAMQAQCTAVELLEGNLSRIRFRALSPLPGQPAHFSIDWPNIGAPYRVGGIYNLDDHTVRNATAAAQAEAVRNPAPGTTRNLS